MTPDEFIRTSAQARALYVVLFEASVQALPVSITGEHNVECFYTTRDLMEKLPGRSSSVIQNELRWLTVNGWVINKAKSLRFLGRRIDGQFHLMADLVGKQHTGEERLVLQRILGVTLPGAAITPESTKRGTSRSWDGDPSKAGGSIGLGA